MEKLSIDSPVGVFDSGLGGLSVLKKCMQVMPNENFIYYGDSLHAPYGTKQPQEVYERSLEITRFLLDKKIKGLVIACNTATSAAAKKLRLKYDYLPLVGVEPAIKPAALNHPGGQAVVMATPMTLSKEKFKTLKSRYENMINIIDLPCPGLMEYIEQGILEGEELENYLLDKFKSLDLEKTDAFILGCTHYPFIRKTLEKLVGSRADIYDGSEGTSREIKRRLEAVGLYNEDSGSGKLLIYNSFTDEVVSAVHRGGELTQINNPVNIHLKRSVSLLTISGE